MAGYYRNLVIENADIMRGSYKNFSGRKGQYNRSGQRSFCLVLDPETAEKLRDQGWNVRLRAPKDEGDSPVYYVSINVSYGNEYYGDPIVVRITNNSRVELTEATIGQLDEDEIIAVDVKIRPHVSTSDDGQRRVKGYLKEMYVTVEESLADKYR